MNGDSENINAEFLQKLFNNKIESIVGTVKDKLQEDAKKEKLVEEITHTDAYPNGEGQD